MEPVSAPLNIIGLSLNFHVVNQAIHFIADDKAAFVSSLGLVFDATDLLGGPRSKVKFPMRE